MIPRRFHNTRSIEISWSASGGEIDAVRRTGRPATASWCARVAARSWAYANKSCSLQDVRSVTREFTWPNVPSALHEAQPWGKVGIEPTVSEVLADPLVQAL